MLSLASCGLDIAVVFQRLGGLAFPNLRVINLSGNSCREEFQVSSLPPFLFSLFVNKVTWQNDRLSDFLTFLFEHIGHGLRLSIAQASTDSWASVLRLFSETQFHQARPFPFLEEEPVPRFALAPRMLRMQRGAFDADSHACRISPNKAKTPRIESARH
jgi:hypothetical protein